MEAKTIRFIRAGELVSLPNVAPERTLLEVLREDLGCTGTKEGCGEGDCGACTVVIADEREGRLDYRAINSCIRLAHSVDGMALWTVEDLAEKDGSLHPAQEAMVQCHGSQCGFCTPGFVMSLFGMYQNYIAPTLVTACTSLPPEGALAPRGGPSTLKGRPLITRELAQEELSGNLCRCTGYRPILDAAQQMEKLPPVKVDEAAVMAQLRALAASERPEGQYLAPPTLRGLLAARAAHPQAQVVAGCTDVGLWVTKMHLQFPMVLDVTRAEELRRVEHYEHHIAIGAAATLTEAYAALAAEWPQLKTFAARFAGLPVRNAGTLGGNVANGSPIGDSMPLLIALGANVVLMSTRGHREMPLEDFYTGYRKSVLAPDEVLAWVKVPRPGRPHPSPPPKGEGVEPGVQAPSPAGGGLGWGQAPREFLRAYKISKRYDDDISAVCLVVNLRLENGKVGCVRIGAGGVAATPARALQAEAALRGKPWSLAAAKAASTALRAEFQPISDMRASAAYRSEVLGNLMQRFWLESQGVTGINLESITVMPGEEPASMPAAGARGAWIAGQARNDIHRSTT
ncbi:MAG TPA: FAD binding domain-containing protein [Ramlibacter sp.]|nr:FAD binding domain-containing protein [Ramlibacter sp.]